MLIYRCAMVIGIKKQKLEEVKHYYKKQTTNFHRDNMEEIINCNYLHSTFQLVFCE